MKQLKLFVYSSKAFSLIEVALVLAIIGIVAGISLPLLSVVLKKQTYTTTLARMETIHSALELYTRQNGRIPCPASPQYNEFGRNPEPIGAETGSGPLGDKPATKCRLSIGVVPYRTLGIPAETILDGWNNMFTYAITPALSESQQPIALLPDTQDNTKADLCSVEVKEKDLKVEINDQLKLSVAPNQTIAFALISHGLKGGGAFLSEGTGQRSLATRLLERQNADNNLNFITAPYREDEQQGFDDIVQWRTKTQLMVAYGGQLCSSKEEEPAPEESETTPEESTPTETESLPLT